MATSKKYTYIITTVLLISALFAVLFCFGGVVRPLAEVAPTSIELTPIEADGEEISYYYFDEPNSVYADSIGILVAGGSGIYSISSEKEITSHIADNADKVYRHIEHGEHSEYVIALRGGVIFTIYGEERYEYEGANNIVDFDVENDVLYALTPTSIFTLKLGETSFNNQAENYIILTSGLHAKMSATSITVLNGTPYISVNSSFGNRQDICSIGVDGTLDTVLMQSDNILDLTSDDNANVIYALTRDELVQYSVPSGVGLEKTVSVDGTQFSSVYAFNGNVYALDTLNGLHKLSSDLSTDKTLIASASTERGFFNMPSGGTLKSSTLYIADTMNGRIAIYKGDDVEYSARRFANPVSVACDSAGTVYVAYGYNKIGMFENGDFSANTEKTISSLEFGIIKQIAVDYDKSLYVLSNTGVWKIEQNSSPALIDGNRYKTIALSVGRYGLFALGDTSVLRYNGEQFEEYCTAPAEAFSIAVDIDQNVFMLTSSNVVRYDSANKSTIELGLKQSGETYTLGGNGGQVLLCTVENNYVSYGDVIIVDTYRHRAFKVDSKSGEASSLFVKLIDEEYKVPDAVNDSKPAYYGEEIIRTVLRNTEVYSKPMETPSVYTITAGRKVIVPEYELEETREYSLILIDDLENGKLIQGYVFKDALSDPLSYSDPPSEIGSVEAEATPIYKWPSRYAKTVNGYSAVDKNSKYTMLDFVESYRDDYGNCWYRIELANGCEGYILANNFSVNSHELVFINPAYNAEIISYKGSTFAPIYSLEDGKYVEIAHLPTGTEVEVVGAFDSSERYTKIKFIDPEHKELGTLTGYVETVYIQYNGFNIVLIVAVLVIVITVILASIIIYRVMRNKKKRLSADNDGNDKEE